MSDLSVPRPTSPLSVPRTKSRSPDRVAEYVADRCSAESARQSAFARSRVDLRYLSPRSGARPHQTGELSWGVPRSPPAAGEAISPGLIVSLPAGSGDSAPGSARAELPTERPLPPSYASLKDQLLNAGSISRQTDISLSAVEHHRGAVLLRQEMVDALRVLDDLVAEVRNFRDEANRLRQGLTLTLQFFQDFTP